MVCNGRMGGGIGIYEIVCRVFYRPEKCEIFRSFDAELPTLHLHGTTLA